ncbi:MAG: hypothetical protein GEU88_18365 [Solirubrobacterales bacterium]|nr:hypothetical protein [Solirubrobacterales bacterium]
MLDCPPGLDPDQPLRHPPGLVEVVGARREASGRLGRFRRHRRENFLAAGDRRAVRSKAEILDRAALEVFTTPAALSGPEPGDAAVGELAVVWIDIDEAAKVERLRRFRHPPHLVVRSGGGGAHAYWRLAFPLPPAEGERAMRMLAAALGGDPASTNRGRLMRLAGTRHRKAGERWCRVAAADLYRAPYDLTALVAGLEDPRAHRAAEVTGAGARDAHDRALEAIAPPVYFARIVGVTVAAEGGYVSCPRPEHEDRNPSCFVYGDAGRGWTCFSCGASGSAVDLASASEGGPTGDELRGEEFRAARDRALGALGLQSRREGRRC